MVSFVPMDEGGMQLDALKGSGAQLAYVMPAHQYPTGIVMPITRIFFVIFFHVAYGKSDISIAFGEKS